MYPAFDYDLAKAHGESLRRDAQQARLAREARAHHHPAARGPRQVLLAASLALAAATGLAACATGQPAHHAGTQPNNAGVSAGYGHRAGDGGYSCIRDTGGGGGQCNAAEGLPSVTPGSGRASAPADRRHRSGGWHTPNECILANGGDYNACNVGNTGRGDLPYRPVSPNQRLIPGPGRP